MGKGENGLTFFRLFAGDFPGLYPRGDRMLPMHTKRTAVLAIYCAGFGGFEGSKIPLFSDGLHSIKSRCYKIVFPGKMGDLWIRKHGKTVSLHSKTGLSLK